MSRARELLKQINEINRINLDKPSDMNKTFKFMKDFPKQFDKLSTEMGNATNKVAELLCSYWQPSHYL